VLAIDDDPQSLDLINATLSDEGIQVVCAHGGVDGLRTARSRAFDLIVCDLLMPDLDGFDVIAALHADPDTCEIPVVVVSAHTLTAVEKARLSGKVVAITAKDGSAASMPELARAIGHLTGSTSAKEAISV
jgi:CheY-like chemotaxis protein